MDHPIVHFSTVFMALFAIMNPIANAPVFIGITEGEPEIFTLSPKGHTAPPYA